MKYVHTYIHTYICTYVRRYVCVSVCMYVRTYVCVYDCTCCTAIAVLRKYYSSLLDCFSDDHITTIGLLSETVSLREGFFEEVIAYTDPRDANERILNAIIMNMERDEEILRACQLIKLLIGTKQYSEEFLEFEIGMYVSVYYTYVHTYLYVHVRVSLCCYI